MGRDRETVTPPNAEGVKGSKGNDLLYPFSWNEFYKFFNRGHRSMLMHVMAVSAAAPHKTWFQSR
jgi:hypothetical protein